MSDLFNNYGHQIVFTHVMSAFVWVGGMIAVRLAVHPVLQSIDDPKIKLGKTLQITGRFFNIVIPFIILLLATGLIMTIAVDGHHGANKILFLSKEGIWTIMAINFAYMYTQRRSAWKLFEKGELSRAKAKISLIPNLLLPINIILGVVALYLGVSLRGI